MGEALRSARERFSRNEVRRILRLSQSQLSAWERQGLVQPSPHSIVDEPPDAAPANSGDSFYNFSDIVTMKKLREFRKRGVPPARLRLAHMALRERLSEVENPWSELQIECSGKKLIVNFQGAQMEPVTGQFLLEFSAAVTNPASLASEGSIPLDAGSADASSDGNARIQPFHRIGRRGKRTPAENKAIAERFFLQGLRHEEEGGAPEKAIRAYQKAIELNPDAAGAYINLGTVYYNLGQIEAAESCYRSALSIDPGYALVHFNLGNVADETNDLAGARAHYEEAIRRDPNYPDPHYNLALVYEKLGLHGRARQQWLRYLKLDHNSQWASYARLQLEKTSLPLIHSTPPAPEGSRAEILSGQSS